MALRKASSYSKWPARPYTRKSAVKSKAYIKTIPPNKLVKLHMGDIHGFESGKLNYVIHMISQEQVQMRDNAIESARQYINKLLDEQLPGQFYFAVKIYPHHILRENKMLTGAGADRMQTGMQLSFGATVGRAAMVKKGSELFLVATLSEKGSRMARDILQKIKSKLPCTTSFVFEKKSIVSSSQQAVESSQK